MTRPTSPLRAGFTILELLIVLVIVGLLAAFVLPKIGYVKKKAYIAAMKNDLRNLATAEEIYFNEVDAYATGDPAQNSELGFDASKNVSIDVVAVGSGGFTAEANHAKTSIACALNRTDTAQTVGPVSGVPEGSIRCAAAGPQAAFTGTYDGFGYQFDANSSTGAIVAYHWDFEHPDCAGMNGDATTTDPSYAEAFNSSGCEVTLTLTVESASGATDEASATWQNGQDQSVSAD